VARAQGDGPCHGRTMFFLEARSGVRVAALSHFPKEQVPSLSPSTFGWDCAGFQDQFISIYICNHKAV